MYNLANKVLSGIIKNFKIQYIKEAIANLLIEFSI